MRDQLSVFDRCQGLVQRHAEQFDPLVQQLNQRVEAELQQMRLQETTLVQEQTAALQALQAELAVDIRFLLSHAGFQTFFVELPKKPLRNYYSNQQIQVDEVPIRILVWS